MEITRDSYSKIVEKKISGKVKRKWLASLFNLNLFFKLKRTELKRFVFLAQFFVMPSSYL